MLRLGISKQDRVFTPTKETLNKAGYNLRNFDRTEEVELRDEEVTFIAVKDIDQIVFMIETGELDGLLLGADIALEAQARINSVMALNSVLDLARAKCKVSPIVMPGSLGKIDFLLSKYPALSRAYLEQDDVRDFLAANGSKDIQVRAFGSGADVQIRRSQARNQMATDIVETGNTVRKNGGLIIDEEPDASSFGVNQLPSVLKSSIQLFTAGDLVQNAESTMSQLQRRIELVINAEKYRMVKYNVPNVKLAEVLALTPERESPTITPAGDNVSAVEVMIDNDKVARLMVELETAGANSIVATQPDLLSAA